MDWNTLKELSTIIGAGIALTTLVKGVFEYTKTNTMKRAEYFSQLHKELMDVVVETRIGSALETNSNTLRALSFDEKFRFLGYFEKVALMLNSGLVREKVVHYMFGYFAIQCWNNQEFWNDLDRDSFYWALFRKFAERMKEVNEQIDQNNFSTRKLKF